MTTTLTAPALQLINQFADDLDGLATELYRVREGLEDGEALSFFGLTDADQELVEEAHTIVVGWIDAGHYSYAEAIASLPPQ